MTTVFINWMPRAIDLFRLCPEIYGLLKLGRFGIVHPGKADDLIRDDVVIRLEPKSATMKQI